jgi:hypothetical protein
VGLVIVVLVQVLTNDTNCSVGTNCIGIKNHIDIIYQNLYIIIWEISAALQAEIKQLII